MKPGRRGNEDPRLSTPRDHPLRGAQLLDGKVIGRNRQRYRHLEFIRLLGAVERAVPAGKTIHAILDKVDVSSTALLGQSGDIAIPAPGFFGYGSTSLKYEVVNFFQKRAVSQRCTSFFHPGDAASKRLIRNEIQNRIDPALYFPEIGLKVR